MTDSVHSILRKAEQAVRQRFAATQPEIGEEILIDSIEPELRDRARGLTGALSKSLGIKLERLQPDERLEDVLTVRSEELPDVSAADLERARLPGFVQAFPYKMMAELERLSDKDRWKAARASLASPPRNEEEWITTFLAMTTREFLTFFASTMPDAK